MAAGQPWDRHFFRSIEFTLRKRDYLHNATTSTLTAAARNECGRKFRLKMAVHATANTSIFRGANYQTVDIELERRRSSRRISRHVEPIVDA